MQAINVIVAFSMDYLFVTLTWEWIVRKCLTFFNHYPLAF